MFLSVIIPVYNSERYLKQCIDSVMDRAVADFELLLINDGSTDDSGKICEEYAQRDKRIKVFHQTNAGVSCARNKGIENASGDWISFVDSDDYVSGNYFDGISEATKTDWVLLNLKVENPNLTNLSLTFDNKEYTKEVFLNTFYLYPHFPGPCAKFYKSALIRDNNIKFNPELKFGEDALFNLSYLNCCNSFATSDSGTYIYIDSSQGLSKLNSDFKNDTILFEEIMNVLEPFKKYKKFYDESLKFPLSRYIRALYLNRDMATDVRRKLVKENISKFYDAALLIYTDPKIKFFLILAHITGFYSLFDFVMSKLER